MEEQTREAESLRERVTIRQIRREDCATVSAIIAHFASQAILLWRTPEDVARHLERFLIAELGDEAIGVVALQDYGNGLMELRSLAVREEYHGHGIGSLLIDAVIALARRQGAQRLFALTKRPGLFVRNGFLVTAKEDFPQKVWNDCNLCPKRDRCIEVAVVMELAPPSA